MENKRSVLLFFASVNPEGISKKRKFERIGDYSRSLEVMSTYASALNFDIHVVENTLGSMEKWTEFGIYSDEKMVFNFLLENSGVANKGIGELDMATHAISKIHVSNYQKVIWYSGRHILTSEGALKTCLTSPADVVASNPDFYFLDGEKVETEKNGLLNDMMFAMSSKIFLDYISEFGTSRNDYIGLRLGSEQILDQYVKERAPSLEWMQQLGVLRRENETKFRWFETSHWHFC